jgi:hypothetical protein
MRISVMAVIFAALAGVLGLQSAQAHPARIILLRHGEKRNSADLCSVGQLRAQALSDQYLGKGAPGNEAIFGGGGRPDAFFAITIHTQQTATPSARSWGEKLTVFSASDESDLDTQTKAAAAALNSPAYEGKTVVVVWEHKHIAKKALNESDDTFWSLLNLRKISADAAPKTWEGVNYDFFWIIDYTGPQPTFVSLPQDYAAAADAQLPNNDWGAPVEAAKFPKFYQDCEH